MGLKPIMLSGQEVTHKLILSQKAYSASKGVNSESLSR